MTIAIVDDQKTERELLKGILTEYASINRQSFSFTEYDCAEKLLDNYQPFLYSFLFLDIYMDGMDGVEAAKEIRQRDKDVTIVFLTSSGEFMPDAFRVHAFDYIEKPVDKARIYGIMDELLDRRTTFLNGPALSFRSEGCDITLPYSRIMLIRTASSNYLEIIDQDTNCHSTRMTFSSIQEALSSDNRFLQVIRGVLVNMDYLLDIRDKVCIFPGDINVPVNIKRSGEIEAIWTNYKFKKIRSELKERRNRK
ncbi:MAG: response regulator transcription factor [Oribacterium sp.]|nr:response regulator transcription factor [Oribacterium sp.]MBP3803456.1 response regulator transcription factor [Oribacterium sp.]